MLIRATMWPRDLGIAVGADHEELVAAQAAERVGAPDVVLHAVRHLHEEGVTGRMAELVVDFLEPVEVDEDHAEPRPRVHLRVEALQERRRGSRLPVSGSYDAPLFELGSHIGALGHVLDAHDRAADLAVAVGQGAEPEQAQAVLARPAVAHGHLEVAIDAVDQQRVERKRELGAVVGEELAEGLRRGVALRHSEDLVEALVRVHDLAVAVDLQDAERHGLRDTAQQLLAEPQRSRARPSRR